MEADGSCSTDGQVSCDPSWSVSDKRAWLSRVQSIGGWKPPLQYDAIKIVSAFGTRLRKFFGLDVSGVSSRITDLRRLCRNERHPGHLG